MFMQVGPLLLALSLVASLPAALAQPNLRSTFPGRRVGGGTRGECTARVLAHLVPAASVYAPGASGLIGVLEGPSQNPQSVAVTFRQMNSAGSADSARGLELTRTLPASAAGVTLFEVHLKGATVWESSYQCDQGPGDATDPLGVVSSEAPPAVSLLVADSTAVDQVIQKELGALRGLCGQTVARTHLASAFGLADVMGSDWPDQLPIRCLT